MNFFRRFRSFPEWGDFHKAHLELISSSESHAQLTEKAFISGLSKLTESSAPYLVDVQRRVCAMTLRNKECLGQLRTLIADLEKLQTLHAGLEAKERQAADVEDRERRAVQAVTRTESTLLTTHSKNANEIRDLRAAFDTAVANEAEAKRALDRAQVELADAKRDHGKAVAEVLKENFDRIAQASCDTAKAAVEVGKWIREGAEKARYEAGNEEDLQAELEKLRRKANVE